MCTCKDCKGITLLKGTGIETITNNGDGTFTITLTNGETHITDDFTGPTGATGATGPAGADGADGTDGTDGVIILHSVHPKDSTAGVLPQVIGEAAGYSLVEWGAVATGTVIEMEFDLHTQGPANDPLDTATVAFFLNESNVYLPELFGGLYKIPLVEDEYQALNVRITLTKNSDTEGYVSLEATRSDNGSSGTIYKVWGMSKFITLATAPAIIEKIEVQVDPVINPITLDRVIIKQINP